jgi:hypothetical protein
MTLYARGERPPMPITTYLNGKWFDPETKRILGLAFELVSITLRIEGSDDHV